MKIIASTFIIIFLTVSAASAKIPTGNFKNSIELEISSNLLDPRSAIFYHNDYKGGDIYCASVNSKNSLGGYVGRRKFAVMVFSETKAKLAILGIDKGDGVIEDFCSSKGGY